MTIETTLKHRIGQFIYHLSSVCEEELTTVKEVSYGSLAVCAFWWFNGKVSGHCSFFTAPQNQGTFSSRYCVQDEEAIQTAITTNLACLALLAGAMIAKQISGGLMRQDVCQT